MATSLASFSQYAAPREVTVDGIKLMLRRLSAAEAMQVRKAHTEPVPRPRKDPTRGSLAAEYTLDENDPEYRHAYTDWLLDRASADLAVACGHVCADGTLCPDYRQDVALYHDWVRKAAGEIKSVLSRGTLDRFYAAIHAAPTAAEIEARDADAAKN